MGALNSVIAVYYYARVIKTMIIDAEEEGARHDSFSLSWASHILVWAMLLPTAGLVIFWDRIQQITQNSLTLFFG